MLCFCCGLQYRWHVHHQRLKSTVTDMRQLGFALGHYQIDQQGYPPAQADSEEALRELFPEYWSRVMSSYGSNMSRPIPTHDGWGEPYEYLTKGQDDSQRLPTSFVLLSRGMDGKLQGYVQGEKLSGAG